MGPSPYIIEKYFIRVGTLQFSGIWSNIRAQKSREETSWKHSQNSHRGKATDSFCSMQFYELAIFFSNTRTIKKKFLRKRMSCEEACWGGCCFSKGIVTNPVGHTVCRAKKEIKSPLAVQHILHLRWVTSSSCRTHVRVLPGRNVSAGPMRASRFLLLTCRCVARKPGNEIDGCARLTSSSHHPLTHLSVSTWYSVLFHSVLYTQGLIPWSPTTGSLVPLGRRGNVGCVGCVCHFCV